MKFEEIFWPDSQLVRIQIEYDQANLLIWNDVLQKQLIIKCSGFVGITNLCIWDDTIIKSANVRRICKLENEFICNLYKAYSKNKDYGGRSLNRGLLELKIELINEIPFMVYCQNIEVANSTGDGSV